MPFFLQLSAEAFSVPFPSDIDAQQTPTFGGGTPTDFTYTSELKFFAPATESLSIYGGASFATTASTLAVNQSSKRVVIDWSSFNINPGETVTFNPSGWTRKVA